MRRPHDPARASDVGARLTTRPRRARWRVAIAAVALAAVAGGCYRSPDPRGWSEPAAKANFMKGCTTVKSADRGTTTTSMLAPKDTCECIYEAMVTKYSLKWDDMKAYESKQADAKPGDTPPTPPKALTKAIADCTRVGPSVESR
ncbi:MAG: hypothetical protein R2698_08995 [Microthrixaceae bacterium]